MSGHSKWSSIKHQKAAADAKRGAVFTKLANLIAVSARAGADPEMNFKLRLAVDQARAANMPLTNIERAIKKGAGLDGGGPLDEVMYEGYGPGGAALIINAATANRNRTSADIKSTLTKHGGRLGEPGSVAYQFDQKGVLELQSANLEQAQLDAIEAGAEDIEEGEDGLTIYTAAASLETVRSDLSAAGHEVKAAELARIPKTTVMISDPKTAAQLVLLMEALDELDDVTDTAANFELAPGLVD